jgi:hypothetical protein
MALEKGRGGDDGRPLPRSERNRDHVLRNDLAEADAGIEVL